MTNAFAPPQAGKASAPSSEAKGDSFSKVLDAELDAAGDAVAPAAVIQPKVEALIAKPAGPDIALHATETSVPSAPEAAEANVSSATFETGLKNAVQAAAATTVSTDDAGDAATVQADGSIDAAPAATKPASQAAQGATAVLLVGASGEALKPIAKGATEKPASEGETEDGAGKVGPAAGLTLPPPAAAPDIPAGLTSASSAQAASAVATGGLAAKSPSPAPPELKPDAEQAVTAGAAAAPADASRPAPAAASATVAHPAAASANTAIQSPAQTQAAPADAAANIAADATAAAPAPTNSLSTAHTPQTGSQPATTLPPGLQSAAPAVAQVYNRIIERADGRAQRFEVRLDPAELGRVDIRIEIGADKKVHAVLAAHDSAALNDLMRGQRSLERALSDAGLDLADNGLRFELSSDTGRGGAQANGEDSSRGRHSGVWRNFDTASLPLSQEAAAIVTPTRRSQRLDLVA